MFGILRAILQVFIQDMFFKKYDIILYGASGFTGRQTVAYMAKHAPKNIKWAIAGRSREKLEDVLRQEGFDPSDIDILVGDVSVPKAIDFIVNSTKVLLTTAGPYSLYGENLISSCAKHGTDYVDITGETAFISRMIEKYEANAIKSGAKIIPFSGFDSVPSDMGNFLLADFAKNKLNERISSVEGIFTIKGGFNGGTLLSMLHMFESGDWEKMNQPTLLVPNYQGSLKFPKDHYETSFHTGLKRWIGPFLMGTINTKVVNRSAVLRELYGDSYGKNFSYTEHHNLGDWWNPLPALLTTNSLLAFNFIGQSSMVRSLIKQMGPSASEGPSESEMNEGFFKLDAFAKTDKGSLLHLEFSDQGDPGNRATVKFVCESALALVLDRKLLPGGEKRTGFLTPSTCFGMVLADRLQKKGVKIKIQNL